MSISSARVLAPTVRRKPSMDEIERLADDGKGFAHECRQSEFGVGHAITIGKLASRRRAEIAVVFRQGCADFVEKIGTLRQLDIAIAVDQPVGRRLRRTHDLLQTQDVCVDFNEIPHQRCVQLAAPGIQGEDA